MSHYRSIDFPLRIRWYISSSSGSPIVVIEVVDAFDEIVHKYYSIKLEEISRNFDIAKNFINQAETMIKEAGEIAKRRGIDE